MHIWEFFDSPDINDRVVVVSDYVNFCVDTVLPTKTIKVYSNDKPWLTRELKKPFIQKGKLIENKTSMQEGSYKGKAKDSWCWTNTNLNWRLL